MICVCIGRGRHRHTIAEHRHLVEQGAELVELRLDYIRGDVNMKRLLADRPCPVIATCRREKDGGKFTGTETERKLILRTAVAEGCDYVDLEEDVAAEIPRFGATKRIVSMHNFRQTPADLEKIHARLCDLDADIVKLSTLANHPHDNLRMLQLIERSETPTVAHCMGDMGMISRILAGRFGSPFTYATFHHERALAPGQLSYADMTQIYHYDRINAQTQVFGVIADPVGHSYSPLVHNAAFQQQGINAVYVPIRVPREDIDSFLDDAPALGIRGLSVTIPHKETVLGRLTKIDASVKSIGAANTILFNGDDMVGYNTDYRAAMISLERALDVDRESSEPLQGKTALVLGAGGAAKAIVYGLKQRGAEVLITNRTRERAQQIADNFGAKVVDWVGRHVKPADILVNCTPIGMHPDVDETPYDRHHLRPNMTVFDTVYNPENTLLLKEAKSQSCTR
ncbi:MAG: shikimate dehydrogenase, partial [Pirellulales bacterium]|nr:shikimate dehydrogenase [Pirellulales bacterium]